MGGYTPHEPGPGGVLGSGGAAINREALMSVGRQEVGAHLGDGGKDGGGV